MPRPVDPNHPIAKTDVTGRGNAIVLIPGGLTGWLTWEPHAERLARDHQVIRTQLLSVDLGLRNLPLPPGYSLRTESLALLRALDALEVAEADLVGWSYGAEIALDIALDQPDRVRSLTLIEPSAYWSLDGHQQAMAEAKAFRQIMAGLGPGDVTEEQLERFLRDVGVVPPDVDARSLPRWPVWSQHRQSLRIGDVEGDHVVAMERIERFDRPVLLFKGEGSPEFMRAPMDILHGTFPHARLAELPGGHALITVSMDAFLATLEEFLAEVWAA